MVDDLAFALGAGMVATVNPCGFAMLPGYLALVVASDKDASRVTKVGRALAASALMTAGFVAVFGLFGLLSAPLAGSAQQYLPFVTVVIGAAMLVIGILLLAGKELNLLLPKLRRGAPTTRISSMLGYGVAFAVASLSCTIAPFMAAAGIALRGGDYTSGLVTFVTYAVGMGLVVTVLAVAAALATTTVAGGVRRLLPHIGRIGGVLLVVTGAYVGYYGYYEIQLYHGDGEASDPIVDLAGRIQGGLAQLVDTIGPIPFVIALAALVGGALLFARRRRNARDEASKS